MAEVNANSLPAKTDLGTNDSAIVVDQTTNAGALVDLDVLADKVLDRITSKTFANQVGGSSAATLLAQLSTLNSNKIPYVDNVISFPSTLKRGLYCLSTGEGKGFKFTVTNTETEDCAILVYQRANEVLVTSRPDVPAMCTVDVVAGIAQTASSQAGRTHTAEVLFSGTYRPCFVAVANDGGCSITVDRINELS